jgi:DNA-binding FadR family transcriptional regulator
VVWHARIVESLRQGDVSQAQTEQHVHMAASKEWIHDEVEY